MIRVALMFFVLLVLLSSVNANAFTFQCSNIKGVAMTYAGGYISQTEDAFSNQTIIIGKEEGASSWNVEWKGNNNFSGRGLQISYNPDQVWVTFVTPYKDILRTYAYYFREQILFWSEMKTKFLSLEPQARMYKANCKQLN